MLKHAFLFLLVFLVTTINAQQVQVETEKGADLSWYTSFKFGEVEVITPKDQRQYPDSVVHRIIKRAIIKELKTKGVHPSDTGRMTITYIAGTQQLTEPGNVGPLGTSPINDSQTYLRDYQQGNLVIDFNDSRNNKLIWRIRASNSTGGSLESIVDRAVGYGLRKFSIAPKKKSKKKS